MTAYQKFWKWNTGIFGDNNNKKKINPDRPTLDFFDMRQ